MGCDIHLYVEKREGDKWVSADKWTPYGGATLHCPQRYEVLEEDSFYEGRCYLLFGVLAGVRNHNVTPIRPRRGLPGDMSPELNAKAEDDFEFTHSHSWLTLGELLDYDWPDGNEFLTDTIPKLEALGGRDEVRIVFWFDS